LMTFVRRRPAIAVDATGRRTTILLGG